jgi:hypothetical protein
MRRSWWKEQKNQASVLIKKAVALHHAQNMYTSLQATSINVAATTSKDKKLT